MTILDKIIAVKKEEITFLKKKTSVGEFEQSVLFNRRTNSLSQSLVDANRTGIIAEFKRKSPSKGYINADAVAGEIASGYFNAGASAVSVLTDKSFFGGSMSDLAEVRKNEEIPILRKDFIIDEYQVFESKAFGSDAILLIAAALEKDELFKLAALARSMGLEVLLEIHDECELCKTNPYVNIIGVNNRNLKTFQVDTGISEFLHDKIPDDFIKISESGISSLETIFKLKAIGYNGFLIGEKFMSASDPVAAFCDFINKLK